MFLFRVIMIVAIFVTGIRVIAGPNDKTDKAVFLLTYTLAVVLLMASSMPNEI